MDAPDTFTQSLIGQRVGGRYVIEKGLGAGGMGVVVIGRHPELDQRVAVKFMRPEYAAHPTLVARFLREARLLARVKSPHFVRVFDFGKHDSGVPYLVMEMLEGRDLGDELDARKVLPVTEAVDLVLEAACGLAELHALGVVHRDLKPSNLFLSAEAGTRAVKVLDFGVSKEQTGGGDLTDTGHVLGTPRYMSPEQVRSSKDVDARSDIWALGAILYELVTGTPAFGADDTASGEVFGLILFAEPKPPSSRRPDLPRGLDAVILKCLAREASGRYASLAELGEALRRFAGPSSAHRIQSICLALGTTAPVTTPDADSPVLARTVTAPSGSIPLVRPPAGAKPHDMRGGGGSGSMAAHASSPHIPGVTSPNGGRRSLWIAAVLAIGAVLTGTAVFMARGSGTTEVSSEASSAPAQASPPARSDPQTGSSPVPPPPTAAVAAPPPTGDPASQPAGNGAQPPRPDGTARPAVSAAPGQPSAKKAPPAGVSSSRPAESPTRPSSILDGLDRH